MNRIKKVLKYSPFALLLPMVASAQSSGLIPPSPSILSGRLGNPNTTATDIVLYFINLALLVVGIIAVLFLIYGGFRYITSAGNDEIAEGAKKTIQNAIIGLVITILSYTIITIISNALIGRV